MVAITEVGCIICYRMGYRGTPGAVHHITKNGERESHLRTILLCDPGHHQNGDGKKKISRHPSKRRFEEEYGTEDELWEYSKEIVATESIIWGKGITI